MSMTTAKKSTSSSSSNDRAEIRIGVSDNARELTIESTLSAGEVEALVAKSASSDVPLVLQDEKGRTVIVPANKISYVEISPRAIRKVGFGTD